MPFAAEVIVADFVPCTGPSVVVSYLDNEAVLYDTVSQRSVLLNVTAARIWSLCDGKNSVGEIGLLTAEAFSVAVDDIAREVENVIKNFGDLGLLQGIAPLPDS